MWQLGDPSRIDLSLDSRSISFENPTGARGAGGGAHGGRKGAPSRLFAPGETVTLADIEGPGTIRHIWMTVPPRPPESMRAWHLEVFYDGLDEPSISVPLVDFFGLPHGRPVHYVSALTAVQEGRGFNAYFPMPFEKRVRVACTNGAAIENLFYYQIDYTLEPKLPDDAGYLHVSWRRENPTTMKRDFTIAEGIAGPGRFLGCNMGIRTIERGQFRWYGEGEVKIYRDGDGALPTICGTGLEDYVGGAWGMSPHVAPFQGVPLEVADPEGGPMPRFVGLYRWHLPDPIVYRRELRVTVQQLGYSVFRDGMEEELERAGRDNPPAGRGWDTSRTNILAAGIAERTDDYCATAYIYARELQPVARPDPAEVVADIARLANEQPSALETALAP